MGTVVVFTQPKTIGFEEYEDRPLAADEVRLRTLYSGISAGTELTAYRGSNPYMHKRWDETRRLFVASETSSQSYPLSGWGYEEVGEVVELGDAVSGVQLGNIVYGTWGHRTHHIVKDVYARERVLPAGV